MNEDQRKWLLDLQSKGIKFEFDKGSPGWVVQQSNFSWFRNDYRIPTQPIPDIPDWRELCRDMQSNGVLFSHQNPDGIWVKSHFHEFAANEVRDRYQIPQQPIPEWREQMTEETKPDPIEEIPHQEQQIQWHEDMLHHLRTGEPMREWEVNYEDEGYWKPLVPGNVSWSDCHKYRRKPRTVTYWHCVGGYEDSGGKKDTVWFASGDRHDVFSETERYKARYPLAKFSQITETTVEVEG